MESLKIKYSKNPITADIYTKKQLKIALDDLLFEYCKVMGFKENHFTTDLKNVVGIISTILSLIVCYLGYHYSFQEMKFVMGICVTIFFSIQFLCFLFCYFRGERIKLEKYEISTKIDKTNTYNILVFPKGEKTPIKYNKSIFDLFYENCKMDHELFLKDLENLFKN